MMQTKMDGKVAVITGGNSGLGKESALALSRLGSKVVLVCRNREKAEKTRALIASYGGSHEADIVIADLLLQKDVRRAATELAARYPKVDVLINNAGTVYTTYDQTEDGVERTMAVNYFAPFLLTNLLLDQLKGAAPSRIVNVASSAHYGGKLDVANLANDRSMGIGGMGAYGRSKLALVMFTYELARRLQGTSVNANVLHPGAVRTHIWAHAGLFSPFTMLASLFMLSPTDGADTIVYLSSSPEAVGITGKYFEKRKARRSARSTYDDDLAKTLWDQSEVLTGLR